MWREFMEGLQTLFEQNCSEWNREFGPKKSKTTPEKAKEAALEKAQRDVEAVRSREKRAAKDRVVMKVKGPLTGFLGPGETLPRDRKFMQTNVQGDGTCLWRAFAHAHFGDEKHFDRVKYDVGVIFNYGTSGKFNKHTGNFARNYTGPNQIRKLRGELYDHLRKDREDLDKQIFDDKYGTDEALQLLADAYDVQIFAHVIQHDKDVRDYTWGLIIRGHDEAQRPQIHLANYRDAEHWTALTPSDNEPRGAGRTYQYTDPEMYMHMYDIDDVIPKPLARTATGSTPRLIVSAGAPACAPANRDAVPDRQANYRILE
jgi:hypothetical protein